MIKMPTSCSANKKCCLTCDFLPAPTKVESDPIVSLKVVLLDQPTTCEKDPAMPFGNADPTQNGTHCPFYQKSHWIEDYWKAHGTGVEEKKEAAETPKEQSTPESEKKTIKIQARMDPPEAGTILVGPLMAEVKNEPLLPGEYRYHPHSGLMWLGLGLSILGALGFAPVLVLIIDCVLTSSKLDETLASYDADASALHQKVVLTIVLGIVCGVILLVGGFLVAFAGYKEKQAKKKEKAPK
jgi:hypothetical protein